MVFSSIPTHTSVNRNFPVLRQLHLDAVWLGRGFDNYLPGVQAGVDEALRGSPVKCTLRKASWLSNSIDFESVRGANILLPSIGPCSRELIEKVGKTVRLVFQPATGFDSIDLVACKQNKIPVCNCPGSNALQTAETTLMLMLMSLRRLPECVSAVQNGLLGTPTGADLTGKTVCIVGQGNIGKKVSSMLINAFDCKILPICSSNSREELMSSLKQADIVSLHCPLNEDTEYLIGYEELAVMKESCILVNTARGKVVNKQAVEKALREQKIKFYAADVYWTEPADPNDPFLSLPNVFLTPHIGASTGEHFRHLGRLLAEAIVKVFVDDAPETLGNRLA